MFPEATFILRYQEEGEGFKGEKIFSGGEIVESYWLSLLLLLKIDWVSPIHSTNILYKVVDKIKHK